MLERARTVEAAAARLLVAARAGVPAAVPQHELVAAVALLGDASAQLQARSGVVDVDAARAAAPLPAPPAALSSMQLLECARGALRLVRNASAAGGADGQAAVATSGAPGAVREFLRFEAGAGEGGDAWNARLAATRRLAWQALANAVAGGHSAAATATVWALLQPGGERGLAGQGALLPALEAARGDEPLAVVVSSLLYSCCRDDADEPAAARARLAQLASDRVVYPCVLSFVAAATGREAGAACDGRGSSSSSSSSLEWQVLLMGCVVRNGLLRAAFASACAGTPLALLASDAAASGSGGGGRPASQLAPATLSAGGLTREHLALLSLLEAHVDAQLQPRLDDDGDGGGTSSSSSSSTHERGAPQQPLPLLCDEDAAYLVDTLRSLCDQALALAAELAALPPQLQGSGAGARARASVALRPLMTGACMLCDVLCDILAQRDDGGARLPGVGAREAALLQRLLCTDCPGGLSAAHEGGEQPALPPPSSPLGIALDLLCCATPSHSPRRSGAASSAPPQLVDYNEETGEVTPVAGGGGNACAPPLLARTAAAPLLPQPPKLPPAAVPAGTRSSLTRLVALVSARSALAADVVLGRPSDAAPPTASGAQQPPPAPSASHGVYTLLAQCVVEAANPLLREWGLLAVRNLCEASAGVVAAIEAAKAQRVHDAPELAALGVGASN